jgi:hypothetical protein
VDPTKVYPEELSQEFGGPWRDRISDILHVKEALYR